MKKITSILLAMMLILGVCGSAMLTIGAEGATSDTWDGTASIKWYLDGPNADDEYELKTAEDLAGLAFLVGAANTEGRYIGVYHGEDGTVAGYVPGTNDTAQQDSALLPASTQGLTVLNGDSFLGKTVVLTVDVVLNEGNAADWATTAPANMWQPIGGNIADGSKRAGFDGTFDGQGHTVSGLYYKSAVDFGGLFGATGQKFPGTIQNLTVTNFYVCGRDSMGALVGRSCKGLTVTNVQVNNGIVEGTESGTGAVMGTVFGGPAAIRKSAVENVKVQGVLYLGIFTGMAVAQDLEVSDCYVKNSSVKGTGQCGLVCGRMSGGNITVQNVYAIVDLEATGTEEETNSRLAGAGLVYGVAGDNNKPGARAIENLFHVSTITGAVINEDMADQATAVELTQITGDAAKTTLTGFDFETVWKAVDGDTPVIELRGDVEDGGEDDGGDFLPDDGGDEENTDNGSNDGGNEENTDNGGNANTETNAPTSDPVDGEKKSGCGSVVGVTGFMLIAVISGAAVMLKKEN